MYQFFLGIYLFLAVCIISFVLMQQGRGSEMGASFGAGASATVFGSSGASTFLSKATKWFATGFFAISLVLGNLTSKTRQAQLKHWSQLDNPSVETALEVVQDETADASPSTTPLKK